MTPYAVLSYNIMIFYRLLVPAFAGGTMDNDKSFFEKNKFVLIISAVLLAAVILAVIFAALLPENTDKTEKKQEKVSEPLKPTVVISEFMPKNKACLRDEDGDFSDWIELHNVSDQRVELTGWSISDKPGKQGWVFPEKSLEPDERILVFASGKDKSATLHTDFALSDGEKICLFDSLGNPVAEAEWVDAEGDTGFCINDKGEYEPSFYPTPGFENTREGYSLFQNSLSCEGPLIINEAAVAGFDGSGRPVEGGGDWVEIKNVSENSVNLGDFFLSDDLDETKKFPLPERELLSGEITLVYCDEDRLSLNSYSEQLYLLNSQGEAEDWVSLHDIPYNGSCGRLNGENGWFFISRPTPGGENETGCRWVSSTPVLVSGGGVSEGVEKVSVEIQGSGEIHYTTDGSRPDKNSPLYEEPVEMKKTGVLRAAAFEDNALPSRTLDVSCIINEGHSLPVLSLVSDNPAKLNEVYQNGDKYQEVPGSISLYDENGTFTMPCGIEMHGFSSLVLPKKNMSLKFRGAYGAESLEYDIFGGGVTSFGNLLLRGGQDQGRSIIKNELCQNLCLQATDAVISQRSRYCVLYVDGRYNGIYALMEKPNAGHYAALAGVSRNSVEIIDANPAYGSEMYNEIYQFCYENDMSLKENYDRFCQRMDIDSLIDWIILEGYFANADLYSGNLKFCRSMEADGKWHLMFYDLDSTFSSPYDCYKSIFVSYVDNPANITAVISRLLNNEEFRDRLLTRAAELFSTVLTEENVTAEIDRLAGIIAPEVERDREITYDSLDGWKWNIEYLRALFTEKDWHDIAVSRLCEYLGIGEEGRKSYFGQ